MNRTINAKELRATLPEVVARVRKGARYTVLYRSRPAFQIVPVDQPSSVSESLEDDPLYKSKALGRCKGGLTNADYDGIIYGR